MQEHIAYYRRLIAKDPQNIDAHLRLGAIWRQEGLIEDAVRAYNSAARLLAQGGLDLEAIAACRAVFELDSNHLETSALRHVYWCCGPCSGVPSDWSPHQGRLPRTIGTSAQYSQHPSHWSFCRNGSSPTQAGSMHSGNVANS